MTPKIDSVSNVSPLKKIEISGLNLLVVVCERYEQCCFFFVTTNKGYLFVLLCFSVFYIILFTKDFFYIVDGLFDFCSSIFLFYNFFG